MSFDFTRPHDQMGWVFFFASIITSLGGVAIFFLKRFATWDSVILRRVRMVHRYFSWLLLLATYACISVGILNYVDYHTELIQLEYLAFLNIGLGLAIWAILETIFQIKRQGQDEYKTAHLPVITSEEFENRVKNGQKLHLLDYMVLDLSGFYDQHPGGRFVLEYTIGRDISKFFYGGYCLEGNGASPAKGYNHSNYAKMIVDSLIVGRYQSETEPQTVLCRVN